MAITQRPRQNKIASTPVDTQRALWEQQHRQRRGEHEEVSQIPNTFAEKCLAYLPEHAVILELGPANGRDARYFFRKKQAKVLAADFSLNALEQMQKQNRDSNVTEHHIYPIVADIHNLPFPKKKEIVDAVYARSALHMDDAAFKAFMQHILSLLKPGGYIMIEGKNERDPDIQRSSPLKHNLVIDNEGHARRVWREQDIRTLIRTYKLELVELQHHSEGTAGKKSKFTYFIARKPDAL